MKRSPEEEKTMREARKFLEEGYPDTFLPQEDEKALREIVDSICDSPYCKKVLGILETESYIKWLSPMMGVEPPSPPAEANEAEKKEWREDFKENMDYLNELWVGINGLKFSDERLTRLSKVDEYNLIKISYALLLTQKQGYSFELANWERDEEWYNNEYKNSGVNLQFLKDIKNPKENIETSLFAELTKDDHSIYLVHKTRGSDATRSFLLADKDLTEAHVLIPSFYEDSNLYVSAKWRELLSDTIEKYLGAQNQEKSE
ncbi:hypothetical protein KY343_01825 [Candidatus Woesearchaeota archaeon]|nr:hypothetical protein [Candidatus Woesearchaeota archaeon]